MKIKHRITKFKIFLAAWAGLVSQIGITPAVLAVAVLQFDVKLSFWATISIGMTVIAVPVFVLLVLFAPEDL